VSGPRARRPPAKPDASQRLRRPPGSRKRQLAVIPAQGSTGLANPLRCLIGGLDWLLRRLEGIAEFTRHPYCLLRIARGRAEREVRLADGCPICRGAEVLDLHLWNEHLSILPSPRRGLARASALRRHLGISLSELARRIETDPSLAAVKAVRARSAFVPRNRMRQALRIARAFGFDTVAAAPPARRLLRLSENLLLWALAWTFNPGTLRRNGMLREYCELWISREALIARYGVLAKAPLGRSQARKEFGRTTSPRSADPARQDRAQARASMM
jgi:hypothetical protein